jgi:hypothetical protein
VADVPELYVAVDVEADGRVPHTHHAGDDAAELAEVFDAALRSRPTGG